MKKQISTNLLVLLATIAYNGLFWSEKMGVNSLIFTLIMLPILFYVHPESRNSKPALITAIGTFLTAILIIWNNSLLTKIIHILSFLTLVGFVQARMLRFVWYGFLLGVMNIGVFPRKLGQIFPQEGIFSKTPKTAFRSFRLSVLPLLVVGVFYLIYYNANPAFSELSDQFWNGFFNLFSFDISLARLLFFLSGFIITGGMIWKYAAPYFEKKQAEKQENLFRIRQDSVSNEGFKTVKTFSMIGLKNEYAMGFGLIISLNLLLLLVNVLDIIYVWFGEAPNNPLSLKQYVHEGTYLLILAIFLAMSVVLFFFRKNLNFYPKNNILRLLCYVWIAQNALLAVSVFVRNATYINSCGLAYKRIGVMVFLALTLFGLYTLFLKIRDKKTFYYLLHRNAWALYFVLVLTTVVNWDVFITRFNLNADTTNGIDAAFLLSEVSNKNLFLLEENIDRLVKESTSPGFQQKKHIVAILDTKRRNFELEQEQLSWLSWNYSDARNFKEKQD